jgi:hypothetical protein
MDLVLTRHATRLAWLPVALAAAWIAVASAVGIVRTILTVGTQNPFESTEIVEGWRVAVGMPLYEDAITGHSTRIYGPLWVVVLGGLFKITGPGILGPRLLALLCSLATIALLIRFAWRDEKPSAGLVALAVVLYLGLESHTGHYFAVDRPDSLALLLGTIALGLFYRGLESDRVRPYAMGLGVTVLAFLAKQPAALVAAIPGIPALADRHRPLARRLLWAGVPTAFVVATLLFIRVVTPVAYRYTVIGPAAYPFQWSRLYGELVAVYVAMLLFVAVFFHWATTPTTESTRRVWIWALSALAITFPTSVIAVVKAGGTSNSWLPFLLATTFMITLRLPWLADFLRDARIGPWRRMATGALVGALMVLSFPKLYMNFGYFPDRSDYPAVIEAVRALPTGRRVVAPEDPTITLLGRGELDRSIFLEIEQFRSGYLSLEQPGFDRQPAGPHVAKYMWDDIASADYVVSVDVWFTYIPDMVTHDDLRALGFHSVQTFPYHSIWARR